MLENILTTISNLKGVHHACLYRDGRDVLSTFPDNQQNIATLAQRMEQIFFALQAIDKAHEEIYFSVEDKYLVAYLMHDSYIAILLTDKKINFPLVHMGIRSASSKIKCHIASSSEKPMTVEGQRASLDSRFDAELEPIMMQLLAELVNYFGPAAKFIFEDAVIQWETKYVKNRDNVFELGNILTDEMETAKEKAAFSQFVERLLQ